MGPKGEQYLDVADDDNRIHLVDDAWRVEPGWEDHPASEMAWHGAVAYCKWLEKQLPSEAEWEKAARGADGRLYPWGNGPPTPELAFFGGWRGESVPVGRYPKGRSPYGVMDMAGQVWEWTRSVAMQYPYNPKDGREDLSARYPRVTRGGNASSGHEGLTATSRHTVDPGRQARGHAYYGFRLRVQGRDGVLETAVLHIVLSGGAAFRCRITRAGCRHLAFRRCAGYLIASAGRRRSKPPSHGTRLRSHPLSVPRTIDPEVSWPVLPFTRRGRAASVPGSRLHHRSGALRKINTL